jgi:hypothetical protein
MRTGHKTLLIALLLLLPTYAYPWGKNGHRIVGRIAENHLTPEAAQAVEELLAPEPLAYAGTWADWIRSDPAWNHADAWHYVTIEDGETYETSTKNRRGDILEAILRFEAELRHPETPDQQRREALLWLIHLVGDIHQPLHVGRGADRGGNSIGVVWFDEPENLHSVWDTALIEHEQLSFTEWVERIDHPTPEQLATWQSTGPLEWAQESFVLRSQVYAMDGGRLSWSYVYKNLPTVRERLLQAGVRLAGVLNGIFAAE